jgi:hypothetical protein
MGIKNIDFMEKNGDKWIVKKVKDWNNCIDGENWEEYKFNYKRI